jgi:DDE superfamily endonuclease
MLSLPQEAGVLQQFQSAFTSPTYNRFVVLCIGAIVTMGRRTVSHILWSVRCLICGHFSNYHRFFSAARWSPWPVARVLATAVVALTPKNQPVIVDVDDTVAEHRGKKVFGKGWHRDAVHSSRKHTRFKLGHRWVVIAINTMLPLCVRPWALPVLSALYKPPKKQPKRMKVGGKRVPWSKSKARKQQKGHKRRPRHKTPVLMARQMMAALLHWFPDRKFILLGDWGFASHDLALFCHRHRDRVTLIARTRADMMLYAMPPAQKRAGPGRPKRKGARLPSPRKSLAAAANRQHQRLRWYGNSQRDVELLSGCGGWYRGRGDGKAGLVPVRWTFVHDPQGERDDYFYSTDPTLTPRQIVELFAARWAVEVTFEEAKGLLGFETTRQRCEKSVLRSGPCLLGLFSVVSLIYAELAKAGKVKLYGTPCYAKSNPTFADALAAVRWLFWERIILLQVPGGRLVTKLPASLKELLLEHLAAAA